MAPVSTHGPASGSTAASWHLQILIMSMHKTPCTVLYSDTPSHWLHILHFRLFYSTTHVPYELRARGIHAAHPRPWNAVNPAVAVPKLLPHCLGPRPVPETRRVLRGIVPQRLPVSTHVHLAVACCVRSNCVQRRVVGVACDKLAEVVKAVVGMFERVAQGLAIHSFMQHLAYDFLPNRQPCHVPQQGKADLPGSGTDDTTPGGTALSFRRQEPASTSSSDSPPPICGRWQCGREPC